MRLRAGNWRRKIMGIFLFLPFMVLWSLFLLFEKGEDLCRRLAK